VAVDSLLQLLVLLLVEVEFFRVGGLLLFVDQFGFGEGVVLHLGDFQFLQGDVDALAL
jgi:hypothetical protein